MKWHENTQTLMMSLTEINLSDRTYYLPCFDGLDDLVESVKRVGILSPPFVTRNEHGQMIPVTGRRRLMAALRAEAESTAVREVRSCVSECDLVDLVFWDNLWRIRGNLVCAAIMIERLFQALPSQVVAEQYMQWMGIPPRGPRVARLRSIANLEERCLRDIWAGRILEKTAALLTRLTHEERSVILDFCFHFGWNANKNAEIVQSLYDVSIFRNRPVVEIISEISETIQKKYPDAVLSQKADNMRELIKSMKSPDLDHHESLFHEWRDNLELPSNILVRHAQSFESEALTIELKVNSKEQAEELIKKIL